MGVCDKPPGERVVDGNLARYRKPPFELFFESNNPFGRAGRKAAGMGIPSKVTVISDAYQGAPFAGIDLSGAPLREHGMAVEGYFNRVPVEKHIDLLVIREIMGFQESVDEVDIRNFPREVHRLAIDRDEFNDTIKVLRREWQWRPVEIDDHPGHRRIDERGDPARKPENFPGAGIAVMLKLSSGQGKTGPHGAGDVSSPVGDGDKEWELLFQSQSATEHTPPGLC